MDRRELLVLSGQTGSWLESPPSAVLEVADSAIVIINHLESQLSDYKSFVGSSNTERKCDQ